MDDIWLNSIGDYLNIISELKEEYLSHGTTNYPSSIGMLYRGQSNIEYKLLPGVLRMTGKNKTYTSQASEKDILERFMQEASAYIPIGSIDYDDYLKWIALAQHYGAPTRFMDWTANPLVALYFACEKGDDTDAVVWICHANNYTGYTHRGKMISDKKRLLKKLIEKDGSIDEVPQLPFFIKPFYFDNRMSAQSSYFLAWGYKEDPFEDMVPDEYIMRYNPPKNGVRLHGNEETKRFLYRVKIKRYKKQELMRQLNDVGINAKALFPGLDGVGKFIERNYRFYPGETFL